MTRILYDHVTASLVAYPRDDDGPVVELDPRYLDLALIQEPAPPHNPLTQRLEATEAIDLNAGAVTRGWQVIDLPPPPPPPPTPDWTRFKATLQDQASGFPEAWNLIFASDSQAGILFIVTLSVWQADPQQWPQFLQATLLCLSRIPVEQQDAMLVKFFTLAEQCHLDPAFLRALRLIDRRSKAGLT